MSVLPYDAPRGPQHQCEYWREFGGSSQKKDENGPSDDSAVINYSVEVPDQVQAKKQNEECNKRDATVLEKLKVHTILDETKTQILSIAGVDYASLSAKVTGFYPKFKNPSGLVLM